MEFTKIVTLAEPVAWPVQIEDAEVAGKILARHVLDQYPDLRGKEWHGFIALDDQKRMTAYRISAIESEFVDGQKSVLRALIDFTDKAGVTNFLFFHSHGPSDAQMNLGDDQTLRQLAQHAYDLDLQLRGMVLINDAGEVWVLHTAMPGDRTPGMNAIANAVMEQMEPEIRGDALIVLDESNPGEVRLAAVERIMEHLERTEPDSTRTRLARAGADKLRAQFGAAIVPDSNPFTLPFIPPSSGKGPIH